MSDVVNPSLDAKDSGDEDKTLGQLLVLIVYYIGGILLEESPAIYLLSQKLLNLESEASVRNCF